VDVYLLWRDGVDVEEALAQSLVHLLQGNSLVGNHSAELDREVARLLSLGDLRVRDDGRPGWVLHSDAVLVLVVVDDGQRSFRRLEVEVRDRVA